ncbi:hypothetical protein QBC39DRAFT_256823 [Podospora conica]|nr:hypothetical protein QBC39DRAFT_256823 [Schizothecium conicum]
MVALPLHEKNTFDDDDDTPRRPSPARLAILFLLIVGLVRIAFLDPFGVAGWSTSLMATDATVTHIVMFQFRDGANRDVMAETASRMYALKDGCVHPYTGVPYINSVTDKVPAVTTSQNTHAFAIRFRTASEREYFLKHDPAHLDLQKDVSAFVERVTMFDYTDDDELPVDVAYSKA